MPTPRAERIGEREWEDQEVDLIELEADNNRFLRLLGIHVSQYHERVKLIKGRVPTEAEPAEPKEADDILRSRDTVRFPGSMTIVVPADRIAELLQHKSLVKRRKERTDRRINAPEGDADMAVPESEEQAVPEADNPSPNEDFTSLPSVSVKMPARDH